MLKSFHFLPLQTLPFYHYYFKIQFIYKNHQFKTYSLYLYRSITEEICGKFSNSNEIISLSTLTNSPFSIIIISQFIYSKSLIQHLLIIYFHRSNTEEVCGPERWAAPDTAGARDQRAGHLPRRQQGPGHHERVRGGRAPREHRGTRRPHTRRRRAARGGALCFLKMTFKVFLANFFFSKILNP